jgi:outer membrane protein assembly factor BamB
MATMRRYGLGLVVAMVLATLPAAACAGDRSVTWQVDVAHTGSLRGPGLSSPFAQAWARDLAGWPSYPIVAEGKVFVVVSDVTGDTPYGRDVYALDQRSGATVWVRHIEGPYWRGALAYDAGRLFVVGYDAIVYALSPGDGSILWHAALPTAYALASVPVAASGRVLYTAASNGGPTVGALDEADGHLLWGDLLNLGSGTPPLDGDRLYVAGGSPSADALSAATGAVLWEHPGGSSGSGVLTVAGAGRLWVWDESSPSPGWAFDLATGASAGGFSSPTAPAIDGDTVVLSSGRGVWAQDASGRHLWDVDLGRELGSPLLIVNGVVLAGALDGTVTGLDLPTGRIVWSANVGVGVTGASPAAAVNSLGGMGGGDGLLVVPAQQRLVAFHGSGAAPAAPVVDRLVGVPTRIRWRTLVRHGLLARVRLIGAATMRAKVSVHRRGAWSLLGRATRRVSRAGTFRVRVRARHRRHTRGRPSRARITVSIARGSAAPVILRATVRIAGR